MKDMKIEEHYFDAEYANEVIKLIPAGYINKTICGCGITSVALENEVPTIIAVPTRELVRNKCEHYPNARTRNSVFAVHGDVTRTDIDAFQFETGVIKIMVTYDSIDKVAHLLPQCHLVIDESNMLISYSKLKPGVIDHMFSVAEEYKDTVSFVSATPTPLQYMPGWISSIPQIKYSWKNTVKSTPILCERTFPIKSLKSEFLIPLYRDKTLTVADKTFSKVIVFLNSVNQIAEVVKEVGIDKSDCGIICGDNVRNDLKIQGIKRYSSGELPMFTFITSSGFQGIDLYDETAMTIVVSSTTKQWRMVDMMTDLKQAISRQRDKSNPNYGSYIYIYNQSTYTKSEEELLTILAAIRRKIDVNIPHFNNLCSSGESVNVITDSDVKSYTAIRKGLYELNEQAFNADEYFIVEVRNQYAKGFDMSAAFDNGVVHQPIKLPKEVTYRTLVGHFKSSAGDVDWGVYSTRAEWVNVIEQSYALYNKVWENYSTAKQMIEYKGNVKELVKTEIVAHFKAGWRYTKREIVNQLQNIYDTHGVKRKATYYDMKDYYDYQPIKVRGTRYLQMLKKS